MKKRRDIFSELTEGFGALKLQREGKLDLTATTVKRDPALRVLKDRMTHLSKQLSSRHLLENEAMDAATGDGIGKDAAQR